jgi:hypothetical protein
MTLLLLSRLTLGGIFIVAVVTPRCQNAGRSEHLSLCVVRKAPNAAVSNRRAPIEPASGISGRIGNAGLNQRIERRVKKMRKQRTQRRRIGNCAISNFSAGILQPNFAHCVSLSDTLFAFNALNNNCDTMCSLSNSSATRTRILKGCLNVNEV